MSGGSDLVYVITTKINFEFLSSKRFLINSEKIENPNSDETLGNK